MSVTPSMNSRGDNEKPEGFFAHVPALFAILLTLTLVTAIWVRPPWSYVAWSAALGVPWLFLLTLSWRLRSDWTTVVVTSLIVAVIIWLSPGGLLSVVQGYLVSSCSAFLLLWLGRRRIQRVIRYRTFHDN